jgi:hypothetical protein
MEATDLTTEPLRIADSDWAHAGALTTNTAEMRTPNPR